MLTASPGEDHGQALLLKAQELAVLPSSLTNPVGNTWL